MSEETLNTEGETVGQSASTPEPDLASSQANVVSPEPQGAGESAGSQPVQQPLSESAASEEQAPKQPETQKRHLRKTRVGQVVSNKMDKTVVVAVVRRVAHPKFGKITKRTKKLYAHDAENKCAIGDLVRIEETRPLSRLKRWQLVEILKH
jgi:small subunit ribosomal protein S17